MSTTPTLTAEAKPCRFCGHVAARQSDEDCPKNPKNQPMVKITSAGGSAHYIETYEGPWFNVEIKESESSKSLAEIERPKYESSATYIIRASNTEQAFEIAKRYGEVISIGPNSTLRVVAIRSECSEDAPF